MTTKRARRRLLMLASLLAVALLALPVEARRASNGVVGGHPEGKLPIQGAVTVTYTNGCPTGCIDFIDTAAGDFLVNIRVPWNVTAVWVTVEFPSPGGTLGVDQLSGLGCDLLVSGAGILLCQNPDEPEVSRINVNVMVGPGPLRLEGVGP